jgi:hypothetical protein
MTADWGNTVLEMLVRLVIAGTLMAGSAYAPLLRAEAGLTAPRTTDDRTFKSCPTPRANAVRACIA